MISLSPARAFAMYELLLPPLVSSLVLPGPIEGWRHGKSLESRPTSCAATYGGTTPLPKLLRTLTPVLHEDVLAFLRAQGADNLETTELHIECSSGALRGWHATNVVGRISLASFLALLPEVETFPERRQGALRAAIKEAAALSARVVMPNTPPPTAVIARLDEHNHPLLIRSDVARSLEQLSGAACDDVRFCDLYVGANFSQLVRDALPRE
jgi:hypothetical protein